MSPRPLNSVPKNNPVLPSSLRTGLAQLCCTLLLWSALTPIASAQYVNTTACLQQTYDALAHEKRVYRAVLFGQKKSADLPLGSVRYDKAGNAWMKKGTNVWNSLAKGQEHTNVGNSGMDDKADVVARRGLFEIRKAPTSDLIPAITQAMRAYQCRLYSVCESALKSQSTAEGVTTLQVQPAGCIELEQPVLTQCKNNSQETVGTTTCPDVVAGMLEQEDKTLVLLVAYDAAYRTLLQFEGVFEGFLQDFRFPLIQPLWETVRVIGGLSHIPCFVGQCDE